MKRILVIAVLAVLLLATVGATTAIAAKEKYTGKLYASNMDGSVADPVVGKVTVNTDTLAFTIKQSNKATLPPADHGLYALGITDAHPAPDGSNPGSSYQLTESDLKVQPDGTISQSGTITRGADGIRECLATGGVFILMAYTSP